jgi:hypothetical protein
MDCNRCTQEHSDFRDSIDCYQRYNKMGPYLNNTNLSHSLYDPKSCNCLIKNAKYCTCYMDKNDKEENKIIRAPKRYDHLRPSPVTLDKNDQKD